MKQLIVLNNRIGFRLMMALCAVLALVPAGLQAQTVDLFDTAGDEITANKGKLLTLLGVIFTIVMVFVAFKLVKRGTNKV
jgi:hypothetical protein